LIQLRNLGKQFDRAMEKISKFFKEEKDPFFQKGVGKGMEKGIKRGKEQVVQSLITELGLSDEQTARVAAVTMDFVSRIRKSLTGK
jgi:flagellar biosynthesis/type III secretory pathway protein FliH